MKKFYCRAFKSQSKGSFTKRYFKIAIIST